MLPSNLPSISNAKIPATYQAAKVAITECARIDECKDWADKAEALASYAKQSKDDALRHMADRIQARAIQRVGELLKELPRPQQGGRPPLNGVGAPPVSRAQAARDADLSVEQRKTALRVANVPKQEFEAAVESANPPTVTELAERGKRPAPPPSTAHLKGRDPADFKISTQAQGNLRSFAEFANMTDPVAAVRGAFEKERNAMSLHANAVGKWLDKLTKCIEREGKKSA